MYLSDAQAIGLLVGLPLAYGVYNSIKALFRAIRGTKHWG